MNLVQSRTGHPPFQNTEILLGIDIERLIVHTALESISNVVLERLVHRIRPVRVVQGRPRVELPVDLSVERAVNGRAVFPILERIRARKELIDDVLLHRHDWLRAEGGDWTCPLGKIV